jgi:hypothetical protein
VQGVRRLRRVLDFSNPSEWLKNFCRKECAELELSNNQRLLWKPQGVRAGFLRILEFAARIKLRKDRDLEKFRGKMRFEVTSWNQAQKG